MWDEPYLETCCRSALHRLWLAGQIGRPPALKDGPCLRRLHELGFASRDGDSRYLISEIGKDRHRQEIAPVKPSA